MTGMQDVTKLRIGNHQTQDYLNSEETYSIAQIPRKSSSKGTAKKDYVQRDTIIQYFSNLNLVSELQYLELPEKSYSEI